MIAPQLPTCVGCVAVRQVAFYDAERGCHVNLCVHLRGAGLCQVLVARELAGRQIEAMHDLADALRASGVQVAGIGPGP